jgi:hypothetical protein
MYRPGGLSYRGAVDHAGSPEYNGQVAQGLQGCGSSVSKCEGHFLAAVLAFSTTGGNKEWPASQNA